MFSKQFLVGCQGLGWVGSMAEPFSMVYGDISMRQECAGCSAGSLQQGKKVKVPRLWLLAHLHPPAEQDGAPRRQIRNPARPT